MMGDFLLVYVKNINAITIVVMNPMSAIVATIIALSIGQETFNYNLLVGGIIIVSAIIISSLPKKDSNKIEENKKSS